MSDSHSEYFIPDPSYWPIVGSILCFTAFVGFAMLLNGSSGGVYVFILGMLGVFYLFFGWFSDVVRESLAGHYNQQVDVSFRWGMSWFIFSEVMFFAAFFGTLFYVRVYSVPWLGGEGARFITHQVLWPDFEAVWPLLITPEGGDKYTQIKEVIPAWGIPAINTAILLSSGVTVTLAHLALKRNNNAKLCAWLAATVILGIVFVGFQAAEYVHAYNELGLTLGSGIYGSTFFMLTGFHGFHVTLGAIMLAVILVRALKGHFTSEKHFAFEAVAWYWHFVDVVWLGLFIFVYWL